MRKLVLICFAFLSLHSFACDCNASKVAAKATDKGCGCTSCESQKAAN
jgi:hypothetical protein